MKTHTGFRFLLLLISIGGVLFSGYMSSVKFLSDTCAFGESCPYIIGIPACYIGFGIFLLIFIFSFLLLVNSRKMELYIGLILATSAIGTFFAGYFSATELQGLLDNGFGAYQLGLPTCIMGCLFFLLIFILSLIFQEKIKPFGR